jgi:hypothetical protein
LECKNYCDAFESFLIRGFIPAGYEITTAVALDPVPESAKYEALVFSLDNKNIVYRKGKVTPDRPGAFLAVWQRPPLGNIYGNKPIALKSNMLDYLFVRLKRHFCITTNDDSGNTPKQELFILQKIKEKRAFGFFHHGATIGVSMVLKCFLNRVKKLNSGNYPIF